MLWTASDTFRIILAYSTLCFFSGICQHIQLYSAFLKYIHAFRPLQVYLTPYVTLTYSQPCNILTPAILRTGPLFKTLWNADQPYLDPYRALFNNISNLVLRFHMQKHGIVQILDYLELFHICIPTHIQNSIIFTKIYECSELLHI